MAASNRRRFLAGAAGMGLGMATSRALAQATSRPRGNVGPNDTIRMAAIGLGGQGQFNLRVFLRQPGVMFPVICDVDQTKMAEVNRGILSNKAEVIQDYRHVLDRKDIDAVLICTPEHWHAIPTIQACQAGQDVYVEKPMCHNIAEGRRMVEAAKKYDRVVQVGIQQQSGTHYVEAAKLVQGGEIGKVTHVRIWNVANLQPGLGFPANVPAPATLNWDLWLGPAPKLDYNPALVSGHHRLFWATAGGTMTDWGTHHVASVHHIMGVDRPISACANGGKFLIKDITETPDTMNAIWEYPGWTLEYAQRHTSNYCTERNGYGILFFGSKATLYIDRSGYEIYPEADPSKPTTVGQPRVNSFMPESLSKAHIRNFLDCMRSRQQPNAHPEIGHRATTVPHLANIALRTGRTIRWDAQRETVVDDRDASRYLTRQYREPYILPQV